VSDTEPPRTDPTDEHGAPANDDNESDLAVELAALREENRRLRAAYRQAQRTTYRRTALGFVAVGVLAALGGVVFPDARTVLFALAGTGLFAGVLTYYLTPERFVAAGVAHDVYGALADAGDRLIDELGLAAHRLYVPADDSQTAWLYVPQRDAYDRPDADALGSLFVLGEDDRSRGVSLRPTGAALFETFAETLAGPLADDPGPLATQLGDGVVEQFELATSVRADVSRVDEEASDAAGDRVVVSFGVSNPTIGSLERFDHPVPSFLAVGLARGLDASVAVETTPAEGDRADYVVTCTVVSENAE
jgi:hypothetical protein